MRTSFSFIEIARGFASGVGATFGARFGATSSNRQKNIYSPQRVGFIERTFIVGRQPDWVGYLICDSGNRLEISENCFEVGIRQRGIGCPGYWRQNIAARSHVLAFPDGVSSCAGES